MTEHRSERPPRLVTTCAYLGVIGAFQVLQAIIVLTGWYSESGEDQVKRFTDPLVADGVNRGDAETIYRVYLGVVAILAASVLVFAVYTAMGHAVSRIMVTITAPLMALLSATQISFLSILVSVVTLTCVLQLWNADVRRWFALLAGREVPAPVAAAPAWPPPSAPAGSEQRALEPGQHQVTQQQWPSPHAYAPRPKPPTDVVKIVSLITLIGSSVVAAGCTVYLLLYEFARDQLIQEQLDSGMNWTNLSEAEIRDSFRELAVMSWVVLPLCLVAIAVSAVLLVRRRRRS